MSRSPLDYCRHILDETTFLIEQSNQLDEVAFSNDPVAQRLCAELGNYWRGQ
jgi:hypothetical protein